MLICCLEQNTAFNKELITISEGRKDKSALIWMQAQLMKYWEVDSRNLVKLPASAIKANGELCNINTLGSLIFIISILSQSHSVHLTNYWWSWVQDRFLLSLSGIGGLMICSVICRQLEVWIGIKQTLSWKWYILSIFLFFFFFLVSFGTVDGSSPLWTMKPIMTFYTKLCHVNWYWRIFSRQFL